VPFVGATGGSIVPVPGGVVSVPVPVGAVGIAVPVGVPGMVPTPGGMSVGVVPGGVIIPVVFVGSTPGMVPVGLTEVPGSPAIDSLSPVSPEQATPTRLARIIALAAVFIFFFAFVGPLPAEAWPARGL
jgi:hypothetical protein